MTTSDLRKPETLQESPVFFASDEFKEKTSINATELYLDAKLDREGFWAKQAQHLDWFSPWQKVLEWDPPYAKWFVGGTLNASYNCLDRHIHTENRNKAAIIWEGEQGATKTLTYWDLYCQVNKCANVLKSLGITKGDTVAIYLPMIPEAIVAMLACARIGAVHTVIFGGFSADALQERIIDANAKLVITADGGFRKGGIVRLKDACDQAITGCPSVENILVVRHTGHDVTHGKGNRSLVS